MSADELRRRALDDINQARDNAVNRVINTTFRPATMGDRSIPASTSEEIAFQTVEGNAMARAYTYAIEAINNAYKDMYSSESDKQPDRPIQKEIY
jgi:hypothetical protein